MAIILSCSIDLSKIDKTKIIKGKTGAQYYNVEVIVNDEKNQYDQNVSISESQSKEDRTAKVPKKYLGNGKKVWDSASRTINVAEIPQTPIQNDTNDDDLPF